MSTSDKVVGVLGVAIGEGWGEIELLRKVLARGDTVHYLALDLSPILLAAHIEIVREVFERELLEGRLVCAGFLGDAFADLELAVEACESHFRSRKVFSLQQDFLPEAAPLLVTYLGNCLGNDSNDREELIFDAIATAFTSHNLVSILVGISVMRSSADSYSLSSNDFFLQIPRYLTNEIKLLRSARSKSAAEPAEFEMGAGSASSGRRMPPVTPRAYRSGVIEGEIYDFHYTLDFDLEFSGENLKAEAGTRLLLYSVTKFQPRSVVDFIDRIGYSVVYNHNYHNRVETAFGPREYAVLLATRRRQGERGV
jgi:hypothetical protein